MLRESFSLSLATRAAVFCPLIPPQAQQDFPQDVYAEGYSSLGAGDSQDLDALCDALRRQREGLEYVTEVLA